MVLTPLLAAGAMTDAQFEAPVELKPDGTGYGEVLYPSPVLHDLDGDGRGELIVGDLWGHIQSATRISAGEPSDWGPSAKVKATDGKDLKFKNW